MTAGLKRNIAAMKATKRLPHFVQVLVMLEGALAEIERLTGELGKAHRLLSQSIGWQRDAEIAKAKKDIEIERLKAENEQLKVQLVGVMGTAHLERKP
jgi:hypothetical protein